MGGGKLPRNSLGVVVPVYNEERWLGTLLDRVLHQDVAHVVAVDDGSTDNSWDVLESRASVDQRLCIVRHKENLGKGAAIQTGVSQLRTHIVVIQDADLEYDPRDYPELVKPIVDGQADAVYGYRFSLAENTGPYWHMLGNRVLTQISNLVTGLHLKDEATCYKVFLRHVLEDLHLTEKGFGFCPEVTAKLGRLAKSGNVRLHQVPVRYHARSKTEGKKIRFRDGFGAIRCLMEYSWIRRSYVKAKQSQFDGVNVSSPATSKQTTNQTSHNIA